MICRFPARSGQASTPGPLGQTALVFMLSAGILVGGACTTGTPTDSSEPGAPAPPAPQPPPAWVASNWEQLIGTWIADNSAYKSDTDVLDAYGIEWTWGVGKRSLVGRLYGIKDGKDIGTFWEFREFWHPGEARLIATQYGSTGTFGSGPHDLKPDGTTEMLQTFYDPESRTIARIGHRSRLEGDVHTTQSYNVDEKGAWTERRRYVWRRKRPAA